MTGCMVWKHGETIQIDGTMVGCFGFCVLVSMEDHLILKGGSVREVYIRDLPVGVVWMEARSN